MRDIASAATQILLLWIKASAIFSKELLPYPYHWHVIAAKKPEAPPTNHRYLHKFFC